MPEEDERVLWGLSRAPKTPPPKLNPLITQRVLELRDHPPANLNRIPGPKTIAYYLKADPVLLQAGLTSTQSTSTIGIVNLFRQIKQDKK